MFKSRFFRSSSFQSSLSPNETGEEELQDDSNNWPVTSDWRHLASCKFNYFWRKFMRRCERKSCNAISKRLDQSTFVYVHSCVCLWVCCLRFTQESVDFSFLSFDSQRTRNIIQLRYHENVWDIKTKSVSVCVLMQSVGRQFCIRWNNIKNFNDLKKVRETNENEIDRFITFELKRKKAWKIH